MSKRSYRHMDAEDRETLSLGLAHGCSLRTMASVLGRAPSTMSCELARNVARALSGLHGADPDGSPDPSATAAAQTSGSLALAVREGASGRG
ncbi:MAG: helix-turn-helix domain-containing protein [Nitrospira sp.]|nr:helix-turn-helix domain-containing protein [Nitrospira sp.]